MLMRDPLAQTIPADDLAAALGVRRHVLKNWRDRQFYATPPLLRLDPRPPAPRRFCRAQAWEAALLHHASRVGLPLERMASLWRQRFGAGVSQWRAALAGGVPPDLRPGGGPQHLKWAVPMDAHWHRRMELVTASRAFRACPSGAGMGLVLDVGGIVAAMERRMDREPGA